MLQKDKTTPGKRMLQKTTRTSRKTLQKAFAKMLPIPTNKKHQETQPIPIGQIPNEAIPIPTDRGDRIFNVPKAQKGTKEAYLQTNPTKEELEEINEGIKETRIRGVEL